MTTYIPKYLDTFVLEMTDYSNFKFIVAWIDGKRNSQKMLLDFGTHLQHVKNVNIRTEPPSILDDGEIDRKTEKANLAISVTEKISRFRQFVDKLKGNRSNLVGAAYFDLVDQTTDSGRHFHFKKRNFRIVNNKEMEAAISF